MSGRVAECAQKRHRWLWGRCPRRLRDLLCVLQKLGSATSLADCLKAFRVLPGSYGFRLGFCRRCSPSDRGPTSVTRAWRPSFSRCHRRLSTVRNLKIVFCASSANGKIEAFHPLSFSSSAGAMEAQCLRVLSAASFLRPCLVLDDADACTVAEGCLV